VGLRSAWIDREDQEDVLEAMRSEVEFMWRFNTMGEIAEEVEHEFQKGA
jgi:hypothetical protein